MKLRSLLTVGMASTLMFGSFAASVSANGVESETTSPPAIEAPVPSNGFAEEPGGTLKKKDRILEEYHEGDHQQEKEIGTNHFSWTAHVHYFDNIYDRYDGYIDRGEVASGYNGKNSTDTLSFSISRQVGNSWSVNIGFSDNVVSGGVGYDVNWSTTKSWSYSAEVNPYRTVHIGYQDWYHVQLYNAHTVWSYGYGYTETEYGQGWAQQWFKPHFYSWES